MRLMWSFLAVRQALLTTAVAGAAVTCFGVVAIGVIDNRIHADLLHTIDTDIAGLSDGMATGGTTELARRVADRTDFAAAGTPAFYRIERRDGTILGGNLAQRPAVDPARSASGTMDLDRAPILVRATRLRGGVNLFVGRSLVPINDLVNRLWRTLAETAGITLVVSLGIGLAIAASAARRIDRLNATFASFDRGDMAARAGTVGRDELDRLAAHVDAHLGKIELLFHAQRQISDNIAHELRTPLVHLDARLLHALDSGPDPAVSVQLDCARADIRSVVAMFDALLDIALAESAPLAASADQIDLSQLATDVAELYSASAEEAGINFSTRIASDVVVPGEAMQMTRLIANLLDNALKYVIPGGHVRLTLAIGPCLTVEDDGPGVPAGDHERIFERFYRSTPIGTGHGLGLALVSVIAARHGLVARVEDASPGARFIVAPA